MSCVRECGLRMLRSFSPWMIGWMMMSFIKIGNIGRREKRGGRIDNKFWVLLVRVPVVGRYSCLMYLMEVTE